MRYKNTSLTKKTFYGVVFMPGEVKDVPGFINDIKMIRLPDVRKADEAQKPTKIKDDSNKTNSKQGGKSNGPDSDQ